MIHRPRHRRTRLGPRALRRRTRFLQGRARRSVGFAAAVGVLAVVAVAIQDGSEPRPSPEAVVDSLQPGWRVYAAQTTGKVARIDTATLALTDHAVGTPTFGTLLEGSGMAGDGKQLLLADAGEGRLGRYDTTTDTLTGEIPLAAGSEPVQLAMAPGGDLAVAAADNGVVVVDLATNALTDLPLGVPIADVVITPDGTTAYAIPEDGGSVAAIDLVSIPPALGPTFPLPAGQLTSASITPDGARLLVLDRAAATLTPVDLTGGAPAVLASIAVGASPSQVVVSPTCAAANATPCLAFISHPTTDSISRIDVGLPAPSIATFPLLAAPGGDGPDSLLVTPDGAALFVANRASDSVSVVDPLTASGAPGEIDRVALTGEPASLAVTPDQPPVAAFTASSAPPGSPTTFNASTSSVSFGAVTAFEWDFGDGTPTVGPLSGPLADHVYATPGTYTVTLTLTTSAGSTTTSTRLHTGHGVLRAGGAATSSATHALVIHSSLGALDPDAYVVDALAGVQELASGADVFARTIATGAASNSVAFTPDVLTGVVPRDPISGAGVVGTDVVPAAIRFDTANDLSRSVAVEPGGTRAWIATAPVGGVQFVDLATGGARAQRGVGGP